MKKKCKIVNEMNICLLLKVESFLRTENVAVFPNFFYTRCRNFEAVCIKNLSLKAKADGPPFTPAVVIILD
jgi:hypothetical protein